ncbi:hypothetical protein HPB48_001996 [Haemaphysalis longicornis]|uniref:Uncharacterized protein n=1 Tax=Haemaphysalis longicornis TaxID=44386 RepID=A0A9J6FVG0_HAELO|nr:hypothetical protein HPB48_001996 [Haemaphysalis longicornis]
MSSQIQALEQEVRDLQSEFETERTDYLETIRKQDQQLRLLSQILDKVQPCIRRDSNYANLEAVKAQSVWDQDAQRWRLPELCVQQTKLPPADERLDPASCSRVAAASLGGLLRARHLAAQLHSNVTAGDIRTSRSLPTTSVGKAWGEERSGPRKPLQLESLNLDAGFSTRPVAGGSEAGARLAAELLEWPT